LFPIEGFTHLLSSAICLLSPVICFLLQEEHNLKVGILSDLHVDLDHHICGKILQGLKTAVNDNDVEIMIIAGDVANDFEVTLGFLRDLEREADVRCLFVPGNHDIWNEKHPDKNGWDTYEAMQSFAGNLANGPVALPGNWIVIGDLGWYDYSFGSPEYSASDFDRMQIKGRLWQDKVKAVWGKSTIEMHQYFYRKLELQLEAQKNKNIILVTHVVPIIDFTVQPPNQIWRYLNAFLGSRQYGKMALNFSVKYSICGHVHYRRQKSVHDTTFICNCLNYASQWVDNDDPALEVQRALKTIEIV
jgi:putative phosphoesterase